MNKRRRDCSVWLGWRQLLLLSLLLLLYAVPLVNGATPPPRRSLSASSSSKKQKKSLRRRRDVPSADPPASDFSFYDDSPPEYDLMDDDEVVHEEERILASLERLRPLSNTEEEENRDYDAYSDEEESYYDEYDDELYDYEEELRLKRAAANTEVISRRRQATSSESLRPRAREANDKPPSPHYRRPPASDEKISRHNHQRPPPVPETRPGFSPSVPRQQRQPQQSQRQSLRTKAPMVPPPVVVQRPQQQGGQTAGKSATTSTTSRVTGATTTTPTTSPWIRRFLASCGQQDFLLPVPLDYLSDNFNLYGLAAVLEERFISSKHDRTASSSPAMIFDAQHSRLTPLSLYKQALRRILEQPSTLTTTNATLAQPTIPPASDDGSSSKEDDDDTVERAAVLLYLLVHQRYVLSPRGMDTVRRRLLQQSTLFGTCPCVLCRGAPLLPYYDSQGVDDADNDDDYRARTFSRCTALTSSRHGPSGRVPTNEVDSSDHRFSCQRYCTRCHQVFYHAESQVEGIAWGPWFAPLLLISYGDEVFGAAHWRNRQRRQQEQESFVPRIYGFALHKSVFTVP